MGVPFETVGFAAREEVLSSDLVRLQKLASKSLQDELMNDSADSAGLPINSFSKVPTLAGVAATFTANLGAGEAFFNDATGVGADESPYKVMQWPAQVLAFGVPDAVNPRIDLVVALPASVAGDIQSRNILVDPVARTVNAANVPKTNTPTPTISVVPGVAAGTPVPPAVPAGTVALFEVFVPALAADAVAFKYVQRIFRRAGYPFTGGGGFAPECGVIRGCGLVFVAAFSVIGTNDNAILIDGEVIEFVGNYPAIRDSLADPFAGAAPANNDVPFYVYAVGGRNMPSLGFAHNSPIELVESLTPPDLRTGRPSAAIAASRGNTQSACFIGCGWKKKNTTNHQLIRQVGDWSYVDDSNSFEIHSEVATGDVTIPSAPTFKDGGADALTCAGRFVLRTIFTADGEVGIRPKSGNFDYFQFWSAGGAGNFYTGTPAEIPYDATAPQLHQTIANVTSVGWQPVAYRVPVRRFASRS